MIAKDSPLQGKNIGNVATVAIRELPGLHTVDVRVAPESDAFAAVSGASGIALPGQTGLVVSSGDVHALCLAPDWWLVMGVQDAEKKLKHLRDEHHFSVVDVSGQRTTIELEGPRAREVLAHVWEQDLREKSFPVGRVSQGLMVKAPVIVWHVGEMSYRVMVRSSFAVHVWEAVVDAVED